MFSKKLFFVSFFVLFFCNLNGTLLTYLEFEENLYDSYGANDAVIYNGNGQNLMVSGIMQGGVYFDGVNDYIEVGTSSFDPRSSDGAYTFSFWAYTTGPSTATNANNYLGKHTANGANIFNFGYWGNNLTLTIRSAVISFTSLGWEPDNEWVHYAISAKETNGNTNVSVYKNGEVVWSGVLADTLGSFSSNDKPWVLGQDWDSATVISDFFEGKMDNVRFYNEQLDATEIRGIYNSESAKIYLPFDVDFDDISSYLNGSQTGGVTFRAGINNNSAYFDGVNDYVEFGTGTTDPRNNNGEYSISLWVASYESAGSSNNNSYIGKHTANGVNNSFLFGYWNGQLSLRLMNHVQYFSAGSEPYDWTHYVISAAEGFRILSIQPFQIIIGTNVIVYKNGAVLWTGFIDDRMGDFTYNDKPWVLGQDWDSGNVKTDFFKGKIDEVMFFDRALSADNAMSLYLCY